MGVVFIATERGVSCHITLSTRINANSKSLPGYKFPNDEKEQDRLDMFHHMFTLALGEKLFLAPVKGESLRVLDIGTGTGIWAIDVGKLFFSLKISTVP